MSVASYDYFPRPYLVKGKLHAIYVPLIDIRLSINHKIYPHGIRCLLDSGADFNLFPADIGEKLGVKIKKGTKREHMGIGNVGIVAYTCPVKLFVGNYNFNTEADFSYDHKIPILGRNGFFKYFKTVTFNEDALQVDLAY